MSGQSGHDSYWKKEIAASEIRKIASQQNLEINYKLHAKERLEERGLILSDVLFVLKNGFVYEDPEPSTRVGLYKYKIECITPNSNDRKVRVIAIPDKTLCSIKIVTVMWVD